MANRDRYEEAIRLFVETSGDEEIRELNKALQGMGDTADASVGEARAAMERLAETIDRIGQVDGFVQLKRELASTEQELEQAQQAAQKLFRELSEGGDSAKLTRAHKEAARTVNVLTDAVHKQRQVLQRQRSELNAVGIDTRQLGTAQGQLRGQMADAREAVSRSAQSLRQYRRESAAAADQVVRDNREIGNSYTLVERGVGRLRGLVAGAAAYLGFREAVQGAKALADVAAQAEDARRALQNLYGSQEDGNRAYEKLEELSKQNGIAFDVLVESAKKLKAFGLDPLNGSMQALIDQNAAVGGSQEELAGKILAVGQAWAKGKLQGEEILQLVERGVPVWDALEKATGKNREELQKLSEAGKLGRETIRGLIEELGQANKGAANAALSGLSGLMAQMSQRWVDFKRAIVDAGLGDYLKRQMQQLLQSVGGMDALAKRVSASIVGTLEALRRLALQLAPVGKVLMDSALWLGRNAEAVAALGRAYLAMQLAGVVANMTRMVGVLRQHRIAAVETATAMGTARGAVRGLGAALLALPKAVTITVALLGLQGAKAAIEGIAEDLAKNSAAAKRAGEVERETRKQIYETAIARRQQAVDNHAYRDTVLQTADAIGRMTAIEREGYARSLAGLREYQSGQLGYLLRMKELGIATRQQVDELDALRVAMQAARTAQDELSKAIRGGAAEAQTEAQQFAAAARAKFDALIESGRRAAEAVQGAFDGLDLTKAGGVEAAAATLDLITQKGGDAARAVTDELRAALEGVTAEDFPRLAGAAAFAMETGAAGAKAFAEAVADVDLSRLGVDLDAIRTGFTDVGRAAVEGFERVVGQIDTLGLTAAQKSQAIAQAFDNAFKQASTKAELEALRRALEEALRSGDIGFKDFQRRIEETDRKLAALAKTASNMPDKVGSGLDNLSNSLQNLSSSADEAAKSTASAGAGAEKSGEKMDIGSRAGEAFALTLYNVSDAALETYQNITRMQSGIGDSAYQFARRMNELTGEINNQGEALTRQLAAVEAANAEFDELAGRRRALAAEFDLLGSDEVEKLVQAQAKLEANRKRAAAEREREAQVRQTEADAQVKVAQRDATEAAVAVTDMLGRTKEAADALHIAAGTVRSASEVVIRVVNDTSGEPRLKFSNQDLDYIAKEVFRRLELSKRASR